MTITLPPEQIAWLEKLARDRGLSSVDEAAREVISGAMLDDEDDLEWVKPLLDEAREDVRRGRVISSDDFFAKLDGRIAKHRAK